MSESIALANPARALRSSVSQKLPTHKSTFPNRTWVRGESCFMLVLQILMRMHHASCLHASERGHASCILPARIRVGMSFGGWAWVGVGRWRSAAGIRVGMDEARQKDRDEAAENKLPPTRISCSSRRPCTLHTHPARKASLFPRCRDLQSFAGAGSGAKCFGTNLGPRL
jgi:hypothetical protein